MSLHHISDKLNQLSDRRYSKGRHDIPKILNNYCMYDLGFMVPVERGNNFSLHNYIRQRVSTFQMLPPLNWVPMPMPGHIARSQWWSDPRVEWGIQNRRER